MSSQIRIVFVDSRAFIQRPVQVCMDVLCMKMAGDVLHQYNLCTFADWRDNLCTSCTDGQVGARRLAAEDRTDRVQSGLAVHRWS